MNKPKLLTLSKLWFSMCLSFFLIVISLPAYGQSIRDYVKEIEPSDWVAVQPIDLDWQSDIDGREDYYYLVDWQARYSKSQKEHYSRYVQKLLTAKGVEDNSTITVSFDPAYQKVKFHRLDIIRDGKKIDRLDLDEFQIYRVETDRKKLIYNGDLEIALHVPDVRPGDIIDYAYSRIGGNPAIGKHYRYTATQQYNDVARKIHYRIMIDQELPAYLKAYNDPIEPKRSKSGRYEIYEWSIDNLKPSVVDDDRPDWHTAQPTYKFTSYKDWAEVGTYFAQYYEVPEALPESLVSVVQDIAAQSSDPKQRLESATDFVQREIRYLGIELGEGGYIPRDPEKVMTRRFGDCKDMTLLLLTLLDALDVEAKPFLVDSDWKGGVEFDVPSHGSFDHIVVRASIGDEVYVIDPTRGEQIGNIDTRQQGYFEKGLVVSPDSPGLIDASVNMPDFYDDHAYTFDLVSDTDDVSFDLVSNYYMYRAESMLNWYRETGYEETQKAFVDYFLDDFPSIEVTEPLIVTEFDEEGRIEFKLKFNIPDGWTIDEENNQKTLTVYATDMDNDVPDFVAQNRTAPYSISHPERVRETHVFKVDDTWAFDDAVFERETDAFGFKKVTTFKDNVFREAYTYISKTDHINAEDYDATMKALSEIDDKLGVFLQYGDVETTETTFTDWLIILGVIYMFLAMIFGAVLGIKHAKSTSKSHQDMVLYPIAMPKFLIMTILTLGFYHYYWIYKNWLWIKDTQEKNISPFWRTFFYPIMNVSLFPTMSEVEPEGPKWFSVFALPLAFIYIALIIVGSVLESIADKMLIGGVITLASNLLIIPVAWAVLQKNRDNQAAIEKNSRFESLTILALLAFIPVAIVMTYLTFWVE